MFLFPPFPFSQNSVPDTLGPGFPLFRIGKDAMPWSGKRHGAMVEDACPSWMFLFEKKRIPRSVIHGVSAKIAPFMVMSYDGFGTRCDLVPGFLEPDAIFQLFVVTEETLVKSAQLQKHATVKKHCASGDGGLVRRKTPFFASCRESLEIRTRQEPASNKTDIGTSCNHIQAGRHRIVRNDAVVVDFVGEVKSFRGQMGYCEIHPSGESMVSCNSNELNRRKRALEFVRGNAFRTIVENENGIMAAMGG